MNISSALKWATMALKKSTDHKDSAELDAEILLADALSLTREILFTHPEEKIKLSNLAKFKKLVKRRAAHEPIAYLIGKKEFFGLLFNVNKNVLIPRPETELIVEEAITRIRNKESRIRNIIDVGTGSGAIAITLAKYLPNTKIIATDISAAALAVAKKNARWHGVNKKIKFIKINLLPANLKPQIPYLITANLPYLPTSRYKIADQEIKKFEPKRAFVGGSDGLDLIKKLLIKIKKQNLRGVVMLEIYPLQKNKLSAVCKKLFPKANFEIKKDLAGKPRLFIISLYY